MVGKQIWTIESEPVLRTALKNPWWRLRFNPELEVRFDQSIASGQAKDARNNYLMAALIVNIFAIADYQFLPDVYKIAWALRFFLITPVFLLSIWAEFYATYAFRRGWATMALLLITAAALMYPVMISTSPDVVHYHVGIIVVVLFSNMLTDLRFALALGASTVFAVMYTLELLIGLKLPGYLVTNYTMVMFSTVALSLVATYRRERHQRVVFLMLALLDVAEQRQVEANTALQKLARLDPLTGLANRRCFDDEYSRLWRESIRKSQHLSLLFIDLDHFKQYNDTYGHAKGDQALQQLADLLQETTARRPFDLAIRNGGEEFIVILPETPREAATEIAWGLVAHLQSLGIPNKSSSFGVLTASIGVAGGVPQLGQNAQNYVEQADMMMYQAKQNGRNRVESIDL